MNLDGVVTAIPGGGSVIAPHCQAGTPLVTFLLVVLASTTRKRQAEHTRAAWEASSAPDPGNAAGDDGPTTPAAEHREHVQHYDYVVAGGGTAGCVLAARLAEAGDRSVLLLERGGHEPWEARVPGLTVTLWASPLADNFLTQPESGSCNGTGCLVIDHSVLGGGTVLNSMMYMRGSARIYDLWAELTGDDRWSHRGVLPYFKKAEDNLDPAISIDTKHHGTGGPQKVSWPRYNHPVLLPLAQALQDAGLPSRVDVNGDGQLGYTISQLTQALGERWSTSRSYLQPVAALRPNNLHVKTFATARRVVLEDEGDDRQPRAVGVEYRDAAGKTHIARAKREVVLSAGALHSPQLLMLSGIGPADHLKERGIAVAVDLPAVGSHLQEHVLVQGVQYACGPPLCEADWATSRQRDLGLYSAGRAGPLATPGLLPFTAFSKAEHGEDDEEVPDLQIYFRSSTVSEGECYEVQESWQLNRVTPTNVVLRPRSLGWLRLNASDPHGQPLVWTNYFGDGRDLDVAIDGLRLALNLNETLAKHGLALNERYVPECDSHRFASQAYLRCVSRARTGSSQHWAGTCRMGRDDHDDNDDYGHHHHDHHHLHDGKNTRSRRKSYKDSVLNSRLRVRGVRALRVVDASAIPLLPTGNTMTPTVMLAEMAADLIKEDDAHDDEDGEGREKASSYELGRLRAPGDGGRSTPRTWR